MRKNFLFLLSESPFSGDYLHALSLAKELALSGGTVLICYESPKERHKITWIKDDSDTFVTPEKDMKEGLPPLTNPGLYRCAIPNFTLFNAHGQGWSFSSLLAKFRIVRENVWDKVFVFQSHADSVLPALAAKLRGGEVIFVRNEPFGGKSGILCTGIWGENAHESMAGFIRGYRNLFYGVRWIGDKIYQKRAKPLWQIFPLPIFPDSKVLETVSEESSSQLTVGIASYTNRDEAFLIRCMLAFKERYPHAKFLTAGNSFVKLDPKSYNILAPSIRHIGELSESAFRILMKESHVFLQADSNLEFCSHSIMKGAMIEILKAGKHIFLLYDSNHLNQKDTVNFTVPATLHLCALTDEKWISEMDVLATNE